MSSMCSNASWKTWTPLPDRFIDENLVICSHLIMCDLDQPVNVTIRLRYTHAPVAHPKSSCSLPGQDCWLATELEQWSLVLVNSCTVSHWLRQHNVNSGPHTKSPRCSELAVQIWFRNLDYFWIHRNFSILSLCIKMPNQAHFLVNFGDSYPKI